MVSEKGMEVPGPEENLRVEAQKLVLGSQDHQGVVLKGVVSHAHGAVAVVAHGQFGDALVRHVENRRRPAMRAVELKRWRYTRCVMPTRNRGMARSVPPLGSATGADRAVARPTCRSQVPIVLLVYRQAGSKSGFW